MNVNRYCISHKKTSSTTLLENNIALVKLFSSLEFNEWVHQIALPRVGSIPNGNVTVIGWGSTISNGSNISATQKFLTLPIIDKGPCQKIWTEINPQLSDFLQDQHMCLGTTNYDFWQGACKVMIFWVIHY